MHHDRNDTPRSSVCILDSANQFYKHFMPELQLDGNGCIADDIRCPGTVVLLPLSSPRMPPIDADHKVFSFSHGFVNGMRTDCMILLSASMVEDEYISAHSKWSASWSSFAMRLCTL